MDKVKLEKVFGVSREPVLSYVERPQVDGLFKASLKSDKQIIVYGSSKQGKTALVEKHVPYKDNVVVRCDPLSTTADIYKAIMRALGVNIQVEVTDGETTSKKAIISGKLEGGVPFVASGEVKSGLEEGGEKREERKYRAIEINLSLAQDVGDLLKRQGIGKFIILENFHYLSEETQRNLAFDLRTFQEMGIRFIILGVWREKNRLTQFNGDLLDRIVEVPVEPWEKTEFFSVIDKGELKLNIRFSPAIKEGVIESAFDSIGVVQELLKTICYLAEIETTQDEVIGINNVSLMVKAIQNKAVDYASRHLRSLESIAGGRKASRAKDGLLPLYLPYYTVVALLKFKFEDILKGIQREDLEEAIKKMHHRGKDVRPGDMSNLLHNFAQLQAEKKIVPPVFDYDQSTRTLRVVDSTFYFFVKNNDMDRIVENIANPIEE